MSGLVEDLLLLARMDKGVEPVVSQVDLTVLAADAVEDARVRTTGRPIRLTGLHGHLAPTEIMGADAPLRQVVTMAPALPRLSDPACSSASIARTPPEVAPEVGATAWDWPSSPRSSMRMAAGSASPRPQAAEPPSSCACPQPAPRQHPEPLRFPGVNSSARPPRRARPTGARTIEGDTADDHRTAHHAAGSASRPHDPDAHERGATTDSRSPGPGPVGLPP